MSYIKSKFPYVSRIEFIRSKLSFFLLMYPGSAYPVHRNDDVVAHFEDRL